jgi:hypothetical protein
LLEELQGGLVLSKSLTLSNQMFFLRYIS